MRTAGFEAEVLADLLDGADDEGVEDYEDRWRDRLPADRRRIRRRM